MVRKKSAVKDKYYVLAKEQGYRARSCFKLIQLNQKYDLLGRATRVVDLCAAPGGWMQVAAKHMPSSPERQIIGVDLLPIKPLKGCVAFQADITTEHCKRLIKKELNGNKADLVLCDGAPNVGADYTKDAFVQSELVVHALRFATNHLGRGGNFVSKVFRSSDYNSLMWAFGQLFEKVEATKPKSSRNVSAEIFVVCRGYLKPDKIDPRLLDPAHLFEQVDEVKKDAGNLLFHKKNTQKRKREGYDPSLGQGLYRSETVGGFLNSNDPMTILAEVNEIKWDKSSESVKQFSVTKPEIIECLKDIKVLGKAELRHLLRWRTAVKKQIQELTALANPSDTTSSPAHNEIESNAENSEQGEGKNEDDIANEIESRLTAAQRKKKKEKKKKARERVKMQMRRDQGMENQYAVDLDDVNEGTFSLKALKVKHQDELDDIREVNLNEVSADKVAVESELRNEDGLHVNVDSDSEDEELSYVDKLEKDMDVHYQRSSHHKESQEPLTVKQRRQKAAAEKRAKQKKRTLELLEAQDYTKAVEEEQDKQASKGAYLDLLRESDAESDSDDSDESDDSGINASPLKKPGKNGDATKKWFDQSLFNDIEDNESSPDVKLPSEKTDKHKRHNKRVKEIKQREEKEERKRRQVIKEAQELDDLHQEIKNYKMGFDTVKGKPQEADNKKTEENKEKSKKVKDLIARGMGNVSTKSEKEGFEVAPVEERAQEGDEISDNEEYNSEEYDTDEHAQNLALGSLLVKKSTRRKVLDAAYNRYAFNDNELPAWFVEDENRHNRPQIPVTREMVAAVKARYKDLASKPMNKVAEARARKKRKMSLKIDAAKRQATSVADAPDMSARAKMRAIAKIYKGTEVKKPNSVYVVAKKSGKGKVAVKGSRVKGAKVKLVDKRLRADESRKRKNKEKRGRKGGRRRRK